MIISDLFTILVASPSKHFYTILPVPNCKGLYFGIDRALRPCLFVAATNMLHEPSIRTVRVSFFPNRIYQLSLLDGSEQTGIFHTLVCDSSDRSDEEAFMVLVDAFIAQNIDLPSASGNIGSFFRSMARLFAIERATDLTSVRQGLWGELFMMKSCRGYQFWVPYWHSEVTRLFDFSSSGKRLEVKTTISGQRIHHFSHRQVYSLENEEIVIASILLREDDAGLSLRELITECRSELLKSPDYLKLEKAVRHAIMDDPSEIGPKYNFLEALNSLGWFRSLDVPHFANPEPPGVSQTSYRVDLSTSPSLDPDELKNWIDCWPFSVQ